MSFSLTAPQMRSRTKTVTRRLGWEYLKAGDQIMACEKCMGRKPGEPLVRLHAIEVVSVQREPLLRMHKDRIYGDAEAAREGFGEMNGNEFINFFCASHNGCAPDTTVTRIEFRHL